MSRDSRQGSTKTGTPSSDLQPYQTMPSLASLRILQITPSRVNSDLFLGPIRWIRVVLLNAIQKTVFKNESSFSLHVVKRLLAYTIETHLDELFAYHSS